MIWSGIAPILDKVVRRLPGYENKHTPASDYLHKVLRQPLRDIEPDDFRYDFLFDRFECFLSLVVGHL